MTPVCNSIEHRSSSLFRHHSEFRLIEIFSEGKKKGAKRTRQANKSVDMTPFRRVLHLDVPTLRHEAKEMALEILM
jgi:hypothetical protein